MTVNLQVEAAAGIKGTLRASISRSSAVQNQQLIHSAVSQKQVLRLSSAKISHHQHRKLHEV